ncbi:MAG TPA: hypothetical protein VKY40_06905 [Halanaerobiales bacterium]|nr:hypothetical protein [Halanaerobiales bacterium]
MKKMKSAYEIAMEKADRIKNSDLSEENLDQLEKAKSILADYYRGRIDAQGLWNKLKKDGERKLYLEVQKLLIDSIGIRNIPEQLQKRREAILAVESLKEQSNTSFVEQILEQVTQLQERYREELERLEKAEEEALENAQMQMKPVKTSEGRTVMKLEPTVDEETRNRLKKSYVELENRVSTMINELLGRLRKEITE